MGERVAIIGQGYVGLPLAMRSVEAGYHVVGYDADMWKVGELTAGRSYVEDISDARVAAALETGRYVPSCTARDIGGFDIAVISVPTPVKDGGPDLSYIESAAELVGKWLRADATVILESTTYPGTTEELVAPILEGLSGLTAGEDFHLGYSPERIDPGNPAWHLENTPKVVSGVNAASLERVQSYFDRLVEKTVPVSGTREAELTKLLENTFRHVNIALVNELAVFAHELGIDVWESIDAASTKPFGYMRFTPGPGVGGHCLPVDPTYLSWKVERNTGRTFRFVELANEVNRVMPEYVVSRIQGLLNDLERSVKGSTILLYGLAYKANTSDARETPSVPIATALRGLGANVLIADPYVPDRQFPEGTERVDGDADDLARADLAVLLVDHDPFDLEAIGAATCVLDCRNRVTGAGVHRL